MKANYNGNVSITEINIFKQVNKCFWGEISFGQPTKANLFTNSQNIAIWSGRLYNPFSKGRHWESPKKLTDFFESTKIICGRV